MADHSWMEDVLSDLKLYAKANELPDDLQQALMVATRLAKGSLPKVQADWRPLLTAATVRAQRVPGDRQDKDLPQR